MTRAVGGTSRAGFAGALATVGLWALLSVGAFAAEPGPCTKIDALPAVIKNPGVYCLTRNLATALPKGSAVAVAGDFVTIDLRGFTIQNRAKTANQAIGIHANGRRNITVTGGTIRGFAHAVVLEGPTTQGHRIEGLKAFGSIVVEGSGLTLRGNEVSVTRAADGIRATGEAARILKNLVVVSAGRGIVLDAATAGVVEGNRVRGQHPKSAGIVLQGGEDLVIVGNETRGTGSGITVPGGAGVALQDNVFVQATQPQGGDGGMR